VKRAAWVCAAALVLGCGGDSLTTGLGEPLRVEGAQFRDGPLPGSPPLTVADLNAGAQPSPPFPTPPEVSGRIVSPSDVGFAVSGRASTDAYAVGLALDGLGSGYWTVPVSAPDPSNNDELTWRVSVDFGPAVPAGLQRLLVAAFDGGRRAGTQREIELCVRAPTADNLNVCDPTLEPPGLVVSLSWDNAADLDIEVVAPDGSSVNRANTRGSGPGTQGAQLERDANANCQPSGVPRENVIWQARPPAGSYLVYVNLQDNCGAANAAFSVSAHESAPGDVEGEFRQVETFRAASSLAGLTANGGAARGLFVTELVVD
jgi:hypothetical protein